MHILIQTAVGGTKSCWRFRHKVVSIHSPRWKCSDSHFVLLFEGLSVEKSWMMQPPSLLCPAIFLFELGHFIICDGREQRIHFMNRADLSSCQLPTATVSWLIDSNARFPWGLTYSTFFPPPHLSTLLIPPSPSSTLMSFSCFPPIFVTLSTRSPLTSASVEDKTIDRR